MSGGWFSQATRDENGLGDIAYGGVAWVTFAVLGAIFFVGAMEMWSFRRCTELLTVTPPILCRFNSESFGTAVGFICGGYAASLVALAGYMAATRRGQASTTTVVSTTAADTIPPAAREALGMAITPEPLGTPDKPLHVAVKRKGAK